MISGGIDKQHRAVMVNITQNLLQVTSEYMHLKIIIQEVKYMACYL